MHGHLLEKITHKNNVMLDSPIIIRLMHWYIFYSGLFAIKSIIVPFTTGITGRAPATLSPAVFVPHSKWAVIVSRELYFPSETIMTISSALWNRDTLAKLGRGTFQTHPLRKIYSLTVC